MEIHAISTLVVLAGPILIFNSFFSSSNNALHSNPSYFAYALSQSDQQAVFLFNQTIIANDGKKYVIGEVQNNDPVNNIESIVYFSKSSFRSSYFAQDIGVVAKGMGMPFKIDLQDLHGTLSGNSQAFDLSDMKIISYVTIEQQNELLRIDYSSLRMDNRTHGISGNLDNRSPIDSYNVKVLAIAMDSHSKILDVVVSNRVARIPSNGSAPFTLAPLDSVAGKVSYYSCFVPNSSGLNFTLPAENKQNLQLEIWGDGKIKNVIYDLSTHSVNFDAEGIFLGGGWVDVMFISGPDSYIKSPTLAVTLNGHNATRASIFSSEIAPGLFHKHLEIQFPFGKNTISITSTSVAPEFYLPAFPVIAAFGFMIIITTIFIRKNNLLS